MAYKKGITKLVSSRKSSSKAVKRKTTKSTKSTKFPLIKPGQESVGAEEGSESSSTYDNSNQDQHDSCLDANWVNMPLGVSWNTQKVDYCNRAKIISPFYVDIIGSHWFAALNNSGNYGVDYSKCCAHIIDSPPDTDTGNMGGTGDDEDTGDSGIKTIYEFDIETQAVGMSGEARYFTITGDTGAKFELEIKNSSGEYYNFRNNTIGSTRALLRAVIEDGSYSNRINFPPLGSGYETFTLTLTAITDSCAKTEHVTYEEVRFGDSKNVGDVDANSSIGSAGMNLTKTILQGPAITWTMTPASGTGTYAWNVASMVTHQLPAVANGIIKTSFSISVTAPTNSAIKLVKQPTSSDFYQESTVTTSAHKILEGEDQFDGESRSLVQLVGSSGGATGRTFRMASAIGSPVRWAVGDRVTGNAALDATTNTVSAVSVSGVATDITLATSVTIAHGESLYFTPPRHYRFPVNNVAILRPGMRVDPTANGGGSIISSYERTLTMPTYVESGCDFELVDKSFPIANESAINPTGVAAFNSHGEITTQAGDIIFDTPVGAEFTAASYVFQAYGIRLIEDLTNSKGIKITNLKVNDGKDLYVATTINDASATGAASLNDFDVTSKNGIMDDVSVVSGVNISTSGVAPVVSTIASSTGKNLILTPGGHLVQNGQTLTFTGAQQSVVITGDIQISDVGTTSRNMYIDLDRFLVIASNA